MNQYYFKVVDDAQSNAEVGSKNVNDDDASEKLKQQEDKYAAAPDFSQKEDAATRLTEQEKGILENADTEKQGTGTYEKFYPKQGYFACKKCGVPIYSFQAKFDSGCGWPAFDKCYDGSISTHEDPNTDGHTEIRCAKCNSHLGHVFSEKGHKNQRSGERHCANSTS